MTKPSDLVARIAAAFATGRTVYVVETEHRQTRKQLQRSIYRAAYRKGYAWRVSNYYAPKDNMIIVKPRV
jgi:hypothetical protein